MDPQKVEPTMLQVFTLNGFASQRHLSGTKMNESEKDERSNLAKGMDWATRITTACLSMVMPCVGGYYADQYFGTKILFLLIGLALGMFLGIYQLMRLAAAVTADPSTTKKNDGPKQSNTEK